MWYIVTYDARTLQNVFTEVLNDLMIGAAAAGATPSSSTVYRVIDILQHIQSQPRIAHYRGGYTYVASVRSIEDTL